jgi:hypothetical protein
MPETREDLYALLRGATQGWEGSCQTSVRMTDQACGAL